MSEVKKAKLSLKDFDQQQFVKWMRERAIKGEVPIYRLKKAVNLPYVKAVKKLDTDFKDFLLHVVSKKIDARYWDVVSFEIGQERFACKGNFASEFAEQLEQVFEQEYGISGTVPYRFVSSIITAIKDGVREISTCLYDSSERQRGRQRHGGRVAPQAVRAACTVCRALESLTNLFVEILYYISSKSFSKAKDDLKKSWNDRIKLLKSFPSYKPIEELHELIVGNPHPRSVNDEEGLSPADDEELRHVGNEDLKPVDNEGLASILDKVRKIRNKIAHPADIDINDMQSLIELSEHLIQKISRFCPMLARISEVAVSSSGVVKVGLYLEVDHQKEQPRMVLYEDLLNLGQSIDSSVIGREAIVAPVRFYENEYELDAETPIILLREDSIVSAIHESLVIDIPVIVYYSVIEVEEEYVPEQEVEEIP